MTVETDTRCFGDCDGSVDTEGSRAIFMKHEDVGRWFCGVLCARNFLEDICAAVYG